MSDNWRPRIELCRRPVRGNLWNVTLYWSPPLTEDDIEGSTWLANSVPEAEARRIAGEASRRLGVALVEER